MVLEYDNDGCESFLDSVLGANHITFTTCTCDSRNKVSHCLKYFMINSNLQNYMVINVQSIIDINEVLSGEILVINLPVVIKTQSICRAHHIK